MSTVRGIRSRALDTPREAFRAFGLGAFQARLASPAIVTGVMFVQHIHKVVGWQTALAFRAAFFHVSP